MRILIIQDQLRIGGTERQSLLLAREFRERGHDTVLLLFRPGGHLFRKENLAGVQTEILQKFDSKVSLWAPGLSKTIRRIAPEIILCMGRTANCYAGRLQGIFPNIPVVGTLRTGKGIFWLHKRALSKVPAIIVNSSWWKQCLTKLDLPEGKIHVVYNSLLQEYTLEELRSSRGSTRSKYDLAREDCVFINVATFRRGKRQIDLLKAFYLVKTENPELKWHLWLIGDGPEHSKCKQWADSKGMSSNVRFFGYQSDPSPFYAGADVAVSTSREDSLPNFLIEAQAAGLPVVAYDYRGVKETFVPGETGIVIDPGNEADLVDAIVSFASDKEKQKAFSSGAQPFARARFSRETQVEQLLLILKNLVNPSI